MAENKTKATAQTVDSFLENVADEQARADSYTLVKLMQQASGCKPVMWGTAIIGFDSYHYKYESGREGDMCLIGFSPRKGKLSLYVLSGFEGQEQLLAQLGKHKIQGVCLHIKKLSDVDLTILESLLKQSVIHLKKRHA